MRRRLARILFLIPWMFYVGLVGYQIWITNAELQKLDPELPVDQAKQIALTNRSLILWLLFTPVVVFAVKRLARSTNTTVIRRIANWRRWTWALAHPHGLTVLGLVILPFVPVTYSSVDKDWIIPGLIVWYLLGTSFQVLFTGEEPEPEATTQ